MILILFTGYYCPNGTAFSTEFPCPPGTYNQLELGTSIADCQQCPGGEYCEGQGNAAPTGNCSAGWYCSGGADQPNTTTNGGECNMGFYCPEGRQLIAKTKLTILLFPLCINENSYIQARATHSRAHLDSSASLTV